jgi:quercetin dioxygenase-like cupin family protein
MADALVVRHSDGAVVDGVPWMFKAVGEQTDGRFDFMVGSVGYLTGPPLHVHAEQTDMFYVLDGTLTVQANDEVIDLGPGDFVSVPPGVPHTFDNIHPDRPPVRAINVMLPAGLHSYFVDRSDLGADADRQAVGELSAKYGMSVVGEPLRTKLGLG